MHKFLNFFIACLAFCFVTNSNAVYPPPVVAEHAMVASDQHLASQIGIDILQQGGNAIDAAVAMGYALAVVHPCCGNLGGGGFMLIHQANGKDIFLNFREKAPLAARSNMFLDAHGNIMPERSIKGYLAVGVPGTVLGLNTALQKYGSMPLAKVMEPAIQLADNGYILKNGDVSILSSATTDFMSQSNVAKIFLKNNKPFQAGDRLVQKDLASTLRKIANKNSDIFYKGEIATAIVNASHQRGGVLAMEDFAQYNVEELPVVKCQYRDYNILSASPPSTGGTTLCEMLNILEAYPLSFLGFQSSQSLHYMVEAMRRAYFDRNNNLGDPDFVKNPIEKLVSKEYATKLRKEIEEFHASSSSALPATHESMQTTHYSVVDKFGNAVAVTTTIDSFFGAKVIAGNTGFFLNNEMDDFSAKVGVPNQFGLLQGEKDAIQPGKRPLSSMTPTIITKNGKTFMVLGSPGGSTITTTVLQTILNVIDFGMDIQAAVDAPRIHFQGYPDAIVLEPFVLSQDTKEKLAAMGYRFKQHAEWGSVQAVLVDPNSHKLYGASDNRRSAGAAIGY